MSSWFSGRGQDSANYINKQKHKQIESLREQIPEYVWIRYFSVRNECLHFSVHVDRVVEIVRDEHYSISTTVNGLTLTLNM